MKAVLALQHGVVPQNLHFTQHARRDGRDRDRALRAARGHAVADRRRASPGARRCRRTACRAPTCTPSSSRRPQEQPDAAPCDRTAAAGLRRRRCCSRCRPPRPRSCAAPRAGWPTGSTAQPTTTVRELCRSGLHAGAPPRAPAGAHRRARRRPRPSWSRRCVRSPTARSPYQPAVGQDDRGPVWVFSGQGSQWAGDGRGPAGHRAGVRRHDRRDRAADRRASPASR